MCVYCVYLLSICKDTAIAYILHSIYSESIYVYTLIIINYIISKCKMFLKYIHACQCYYLHIINIHTTHILCKQKLILM